MPPKNTPTRRLSRSTQEDEERRASRSSCSTIPGSSSATTPPLLLLPAPPGPLLEEVPAPAAPAPAPPAPTQPEVDDELAGMPEWLRTWKRSVSLGYDRPTTQEEAANIAQSMDNKRGSTKKSNLARQMESTGIRIPVVWDLNLNGPNAAASTAMTRDWGVWVRRDIPMNHATFEETPDHVFDDMMADLSVIYDIPRDDHRFRAWLKVKAAENFRSFKSSCATEYFKNGSAPPHPIEFRHRVGQWRWLMEHFKTLIDIVLSKAGPTGRENRSRKGNLDKTEDHDSNHQPGDSNHQGIRIFTHDSNHPSVIRITFIRAEELDEDLGYTEE